MNANYDSVESEYFRKLLDRHHTGASESDIRIAFRDFLVRTGIAFDESEISTETRPAANSRLKVDLYIRNTYVEFKRSILSSGRIDREHVRQLDAYILENAQAGNGIQNGILTDGVNYLKRSVGDHLRPLVTESGHTVFSKPEQGVRLYEFLRDIVDTQAESITPSAEMLTKYFGLGSDVFKTSTALLTAAHGRSRSRAEVAVKRNLWKELLQVALGQDSVNDSDTNDWLYVRHTYLTSLIAVIVQAYFGIDVGRYSHSSPRQLLAGDFLRQETGLKGITESDLFNWPVQVGEAEYLRTIALQVARFDWQQNPGDLAATLYQNAILPEEREKMGEYYTPRWLAKAITEELVTDPADTRVLDPACGSGTFIAAAIDNFMASTEEMPPLERLERLHQNVTGIDLHPVAVQLAKATWVMASYPVIRAAREAGHGGEEVVVPIHLGDALQLRYDNSQLIAQSYIELRTREVLEDTGGEIVFQVPLKLAQQVERFDSLMLSIADAIDRGDDTDRILDIYDIEDPEDREPLLATIANMKKLHAVGRNHVWAYYLRNMSRPAVISEQKVDAIVGNPPWLTYQKSAGIIRDEIENLSKNQYQIWAGGRNAPHQDVATLFFCRVMDLYLRPGGTIGMVLPHSALRSGQHLKWRNAYYEAKRPPRSRLAKRAISTDFSVKVPWDLSVLEDRDFFPMASCVAFASFPGGWGDAGDHLRSANPLAPGQVEVWQGLAGSDSVERVVTELIHDDGTFRSPYAAHSNQGPTIVDRRLFFVTVHPLESQFALPNIRRTFPAVGSLDKKSYSVDALRGLTINEDNLFEVHLGATVAPYVTLSPRTAVLPASRREMAVPLDHSNCEMGDKGEHIGKLLCTLDEQALDASMRSRWEIMARLWDANKGKDDNKTLYQNLNWLNKLAAQLDYLRAAECDAIQIAYSSSGRPTAALIRDSEAILDYTLFQLRCSNLDEAHYLLAIINSVALEEAMEPFRPKGLYGARHVQKHPWKLPIPKYAPAVDTHAELSRLGRAAEQSANERIASLREAIGNDALTVTKVRSELRSNWQKEEPVCVAIEKAVDELLQSG